MEQTRAEQFASFFPEQPRWRFSQIERALFNPEISGWEDISNLPQDMRGKLASSLPWISVARKELYKSKDGQTRKALLKFSDGQKIETVLMKNKRGQYSVCVSSQAGCAMGCIFCATGAIGLKRNLTADEIADQLRFWKYFLHSHGIKERVSNIVIMGMGEPLANYDNVKTAIGQWLEYTDIGANHITVSTVGLLPDLQKILADKTWPPVRIAISLHSADEASRKKIVPTTSENYLQGLEKWIKEYLKTKAGNKRHLTFEYVLLAGINDSPRDAKLLGDFVAKTGRVKVNLIPFNDISDKALQRSRAADEFALILKKCGVMATVRQSAGQDIMAACGQLAGKSGGSA
ncbi:MAG: 23S rRNA (adenine(2503)-C(2))-methyltransferase RlmN [Patescibacteria group bacterium]|jgi:23S rRNA (adenine2503-C2)-methyltransferase